MRWGYAGVVRLTWFSLGLTDSMWFVFLLRAVRAGSAPMHVSCHAQSEEGLSMANISNLKQKGCCVSSTVLPVLWFSALSTKSKVFKLPKSLVEMCEHGGS